MKNQAKKYFFEGRGEEGAVLTILAIMAVVLLLAVGLGLDTMIFGSSKAQRRHSAEYVALAAIREFSQSTGASPGARLIDAKDRAEEIAGVNFFIGRTQQFGGSTLEELGPLGPEGSFVPDGPTGKITPGLWYAQPPWNASGNCAEPNGLSSIAECPCNTSGRWNGACFRPLDFNDPTESAITPNAFRAELWMRAGTKLWTLFSRIVGKDYFWIYSEATAAVIPTHHVLLLDLSRASTLERHLPYERTGFSTEGTPPLGPSEYAYRLISPSTCTANSSPCSAQAPPATPLMCSTTMTPIVNTTNCTLSGGFQNAIFNYWCPGRKNHRQTRVIDPANTSHVWWNNLEKHARDEYLCAPVSYTEEGVPTTEYYIVDGFRGMTTENTSTQKFYDGPEPLTTMLAGVHEATQAVSQRSVSGDLLGMIGVDESANIAIRTFQLSSPGSTTFTDLEDISNIDISAGWQTRLQKRNEHMIFPRYNARLDLPEALFQARQMLRAQPNSATAERIVTYIGDGVSNCFGDQSRPDVKCGSSETDFVRPSIDASVNYVESTYRKDNIKFNFLMIGDLVAPHNLVRRGLSPQTQNGCMSDEEAAEAGLEWIEISGGTNDILAEAIMKRVSPEPFFYYPNKLQEGVARTGGIFRPIRNACNGASCVAATNQTNLQNACTDPAVPPGGLALPVANLIDSNSRITCDPTCTTRRDQIRQAIRRIYFRNPYTLVH